MRSLAAVLLIGLAGCGGTSAPPQTPARQPRHVIVCIADGWGYQHIAATKAYCGDTPPYAGWDQRAMATWDLDTQRSNGGVGYDPAKAWSERLYNIAVAADSASTATGMFTGVKTDKGNIGMGPGDREALQSIHDLAVDAGLGSGAVSSVPISHATVGAWYAHNESRRNGLAIANQGLWGDPLATGDAQTPLHAGHRGPSASPLTVLIGGGHPAWSAKDDYVSPAIRDRLAGENGRPDAWTYVERTAGRQDGGARLLEAARDARTTRLAGLFGGRGGNLDWCGPDLATHDAENASLSEMAQAALLVLKRQHPTGFVLMVEGGAIDWGGHGNTLGRVIGEQRAFDAMVRAVVAWVEDPTNGSSWGDTLVIVTGDHECGFLTADPKSLPDTPLGPITPETLAQERPYSRTRRRASWSDTNGNHRIDEGETVHWAWGTGYHSNALIPCYAKGRGAARLWSEPVGTDPKRGEWIENTTVFHAMRAALLGSQ